MKTPSTGHPWLSILIPAYNVAPYLGACLRSVAEQCLEGVEVLILDDHSTDDTEAEILSFLETHPTVPLALLKHPKNKGLSAARNTLLEHSRGEWVWFLDSDDLLLDGAVRAVRAAVERHTPDLVITGYKTIDERPGRSSFRKIRYRTAFRGPVNRLVTDGAAVLEGVLKCGKWYAWNKIARRDLWGDLRFPEGRYYEDMACMPELLLRARKALFTAHPCVGYRHRAGSILQTPTEKKILDHFWAAGRATAACREQNARLSRAGRFALACHVASNRSVAIQQLRHLVTPPSAAEIGRLRENLLSDLPCSAKEYYVACLFRLRLRQAWSLWRCLHID